MAKKAKSKLKETVKELTMENRIKLRQEDAYFRLKAKLEFHPQELDEHDYKELLVLLKQHEDYPEGIPGVVKKIEDLEEKVFDLNYQLEEFKLGEDNSRLEMVNTLKKVSTEIFELSQQIRRGRSLLAEIDEWMTICPPPKDEGEDRPEGETTPFSLWVYAQEAVKDFYKVLNKAEKHGEDATLSSSEIISELEKAREKR